MARTFHSAVGAMRSTDRLFTLLGILQDGQARPLSSLATGACLPKSTVLRLLRSLERRGWVQRSGDRYALGAAVVSLAHRYLAAASPAIVAGPPMEELRDRLGETVSLSAVSGSVRVCIQELPSRHELRHVHNVGSIGPLHAGASGRLLLAYLPDEDRTRVLSGRLPRFTPRTITDRARIEREGALIRRRGYVISRGEKTPGSVAIAVPLRMPTSDATYALAIFAPQVRFREEDGKAWIRALIECAAEVAGGASTRRTGAFVA